MSLICPRCQGKMRSFERSGVTVDQCKNCSGVFFDQGELEHLLTAEARFLGLVPRDPADEPAPITDYDAPRRPASEDRRRADRSPGDDRAPADRKSRGKIKKRKKTFLQDFFD